MVIHAWIRVLYGSWMQLQKLVFTGPRVFKGPSLRSVHVEKRLPVNVGRGLPLRWGNYEFVTLVRSTASQSGSGNDFCCHLSWKKSRGHAPMSCLLRSSTFAVNIIVALATGKGRGHQVTVADY